MPNLTTNWGFKYSKRIAFIFKILISFKKMLITKYKLDLVSPGTASSQISKKELVMRVICLPIGLS